MRDRYPFTPGDNMTGQCSACMEVFYGEDAFDRHRRGEEPHRHCIDPATDEPRKDGRRYWLDKRQRWHYGPVIDADAYEQRAQARGVRLKTARESTDTQGTGRVPAQAGIPGRVDVPRTSEPQDSEDAA